MTEQDATMTAGGVLILLCFVDGDGNLIVPCIPVKGVATLPAPAPHTSE